MECCTVVTCPPLNQPLHLERTQNWPGLEDMLPMGLGWWLYSEAPQDLIEVVLAEDEGKKQVQISIIIIC